MFKSDVVTAVKVVDHIVAINAGGRSLMIANCQSLCESCHKSEENANLGVWGKISLVDLCPYIAV
jgi:5-methylcytosine-specific restriction endonuclease McrA